MNPASITSLRYTDRLDELGIAPSVGSRGDAYDNAMAEAFVATFKAECTGGRPFPSFERAEHEVLRWIGFYNAGRLHEELGDLPPAEFEENFRNHDHADARSGDLRAVGEHLKALVPPYHRPCGPAEADRPALGRGAPVGLGTSEATT